MIRRNRIVKKKDEQETEKDDFYLQLHIPYTKKHIDIEKGVKQNKNLTIPTLPT